LERDGWESIFPILTIIPARRVLALQAAAAVAVVVVVVVVVA
jgi:hypothetical protein